MSYVNEALQAKMQEIGFKLTREKISGGVMTKLEGTPAQIIAWSSLIRGDGLDGLAPQSGQVKGYLLSQNDEWIGGTYDKLLAGLGGDVDMTKHHEERARLAKTGFSRKLQEKIAMVAPKRKRTIAEHDGDWNYDRRWDAFSFEATKKALGAGRTLKIIVNLAASSGVQANELNKFGTQVWAISDLIENAGIQTEIIARYRCNRVGHLKKGGRVDFEGLIKLKEPTQFVTPTRLAACFTSNFWRRPVFTLMCAASQLENGDIDFGLGSPQHGGYPIKFEIGRGELTVNIETLRENPNNVEAEILKAISATVGGAA